MGLETYNCLGLDWIADMHLLPVTVYVQPALFTGGFHEFSS